MDSFESLACDPPLRLEMPTTGFVDAQISAAKVQGISVAKFDPPSIPAPEPEYLPRNAHGPALPVMAFHL